MAQVLPEVLVDYLNSKCCINGSQSTYLKIGVNQYLLIGTNLKIRI